jgi:hypothetical protein
MREDPKELGFRQFQVGEKVVLHKTGSASDDSRDYPQWRLYDTEAVTMDSSQITGKESAHKRDARYLHRLLIVFSP